MYMQAAGVFKIIYLFNYPWPQLFFEVPYYTFMLVYVGVFFNFLNEYLKITQHADNTELLAKILYMIVGGIVF